ncbi:MAG TPA: NAD(P)(+) transhydrogenase (Re/Si-specific) subunit alpha, partial [Mariprofundaceae bacterium]|nr:NAD(P)(+) transhydrogenase (Re/Si-specific) subunit alpha [Mariprofundaceae bacterium]
MRIAVPAETRAFEARVAATPETVKKFIAAGCEVVVEQGAGTRACFTDAAYREVGAKLESSYSAACHDADVVLKVQAPDASELAQTPQGAAVVAMFSPYANPLLADYAEAGLSCFAMELVPRISRAQGMDVLS